MIGRAIVQGVCIVAVALAIGTVHALVKPVTTWDSEKPSPPPPAPVPAKPPVAAPLPNGGAGTPAPVQPTPPAPVAPHDDRMVSLARLKELMSAALPAQVIDAREPADFAAGRIPGAINIPPGEFFGKVPEAVNVRLSRDLPVVVYCSGGNCDASKLVAVRLKDLGFAQTFVYEEGFTGWTKAGEAVEK